MSRLTRRRTRAGLPVAALLALPGVALAQRAQSDAPMPLRAVIREDLFIDRDIGAQIAAGFAIPAAYNVRLGVEAGIGAVRRPEQGALTGRIDLLARWLSDPFRQSRWAFAAGGGVGQRVEERGRPRTVAIVTLGLEGPSDGTWVPGVEMGLGGGVRLGITLRRAPSRQR